MRLNRRYFHKRLKAETRFLFFGIVLDRLYSSLMLMLLFVSMLAIASDIKVVRATGTIYIRADGSVDPADAPIITYDNVTYTLTGNVTSSGDGIVIERDNIVLDGDGYTVNGSNTFKSKGVDLSSRDNVTIKNTHITAFNDGIWLNYSSDNIFSGNNITNNGHGVKLYESSNNTINGNSITHNNLGIWLYYSFNNTVSGNNITNNERGFMLDYSSNNTVNGNSITANNDYGVMLWYSFDNRVSRNSITNNGHGVELIYSSNNMVSGNSIANNGDGLVLAYSLDNMIYHNNFIDNSQQTNIVTAGYGNVWDNGYPSGGNYWSNYTGADLYRGASQNETGSDGIGDTPYVIDGNNKDNYPLMKPYPWRSHDIGITSSDVSKTVVGQGYGLHINATIFNYSNNTENFNLTVYANTTMIGTFENVTLTSRNSITITFTWNTTGFSKGNYTVWAHAWPVLGETEISDNNSTDGWIFVTIPGDVDGDKDVDIFDIVSMAGVYGEVFPPVWPIPPPDIDGDGDVDIFDIVIAAGNYGKSW